MLLRCRFLRLLALAGSYKIYEANVQLDNRKHYERLKAPMVKTTQEKVNDLISRLHQGEHTL